MEKFKAVEKEMKTKQYSKEGLSAATKLDPKEQEKLECCDFISDMVGSLSQQIEGLEAEMETLQAGLKKKKTDAGKVDRLSELERTVERHKWHSGKLEIVLRALENGSVDVEQVKEVEDGIKYYVEQNQEVDFMEDDTLYDDLNLEEEEGLFGMLNDDRSSSQDAQSVQDEPPENEPSRSTSTAATKVKSHSVSETAAPARRPSIQMKSPLPALSSLHSSLPSNASGKQPEAMKPAPLPTIPTGQPLKYASAAAAAAASDRSGVGIAPLPPPPGAAKSSEEGSPVTASVQSASIEPSPSQPIAPQPAKVIEPSKQPSPAPPKEDTRAVEPREPITAQSSKAPSAKPSPQVVQAQPSQLLDTPNSKAPGAPSPDSGVAGLALSNGQSAPEEEEEEEESIYHLPSSLTDLLDSFEETKTRAKSSQPFDIPMLNASRLSAPLPSDSEKPNHYVPSTRFPYTPSHYPQEPMGIFDDPRLYSRIDTDSLFYNFYYNQGTHQQYLAARALKGQSWRFHKQYQTWFQRHEEPKTITEEYEQGTYRFFDYESTW